MSKQDSQSERLPIKEHIEDRERYYHRLLRHTLIRLLLIYMVPFVVVVGFFLWQYHGLMVESRESHLKSTAEHHSYMLDLFLTERILNLTNLIENPKLTIPPTSEEIHEQLESLQKSSHTFIDLGYYNASGNCLRYAGPFPELQDKNYLAENWFKELEPEDVSVVITDIYMGFRGKPHFTIALDKMIHGTRIVVRVVLSPEKIHANLTKMEKSRDVISMIVNREGKYQVVPDNVGNLSEKSPLQPESEPWLGISNGMLEDRKTVFAYAWMKTAPWSVIVIDAFEGANPGSLEGMFGRIMLFALVVFGSEFLLIIIRARSVVKTQRRYDETEANLSGHLVHAARLASVGELAAGIAHEINNPLAVITEEIGLVKDCMNPEFGVEMQREELLEHLDSVYKAAFRARDITSKLLGFVRQKEIKLEEYDLHEIIDEVLDGLLGSELSFTEINVVRDYNPSLPVIFTDKNQLVQVILNIIKNATDAMRGEGTLTVHTRPTKDKITLSISDTGCGMTEEQMSKIFNPFYTTKEVGKGTGLGLSVSFGIVKNLGGNIYVNSQVNKGSMFTIDLPVDLRSKLIFQEMTDDRE